MAVKGENKYDVMVILTEIYRMKMLSVEQLTQIIFNNSRYGHRFMDNLEKNEGLVNSRVVSDGKKRLGKAFYLSDKGIGLLNKAKAIERVRLAKDNVPDKSKMSHTLRINNIYAGLTPYGIHVYDSREWKERFGMDRNALTRGGLQMPDSREYAIYTFFPASYEKEWNVSDRTVKSFHNELRKALGINRIVIMCDGEQTYSRFVKETLSDHKDSQLISKKEVLILPQGKKNFGNAILKLCSNTEMRKQMLSEALKARLYSEHEALTPNTARHLAFTNYVGVDNTSGESFFVVDMLTYDYSLIKKMKAHYREEWLDKGVYKVRVVCFEGGPGFESPKSVIKRELRNSNVEVIEAKLGMLVNKYLLTMEPVKIGQM